MSIKIIITQDDNEGCVSTHTYEGMTDGEAIRDFVDTEIAKNFEASSLPAFTRALWNLAGRVQVGSSDSCQDPSVQGTLTFARVLESAWKPDYSVTPRRVVCAANRHRCSGLVLCGARHWDKVMRGQVRALRMDPNSGWDQGFIDQFGDWMTREEAWLVAESQGQIRRDVSCPGTLYSENLY